MVVIVWLSGLTGLLWLLVPLLLPWLRLRAVVKLWWLIARGVDVELGGGEGDGDDGDMAGHLEGNKALLDGLPDVGDGEGADGGVLVEGGDALLEDLSDGDGLADGLAHGLEDDLGEALVLEQRCGVVDIVADHALRSDSDLVLQDHRLRARPLHPLVPIHG